MKNMRLIYSDFVPNRPEPTSLLELWCLLGGTILVIFIAFDSGTGFVGKPTLETILSLVLPAIYFYIHYLARYVRFMNFFLILSIIASFMFSSYVFFYPLIPHQSLPNSNIALMIFSCISLLLVAKNRCDFNKV